MNVFLKVKIKSLAAEAKIIRMEEKRATTNGVREGLYLHRVNDVRTECRAANLAYGFLRGREYKRIENKATTPPKWDRVERMVRKYGQDDPRELMQRFSEWKDSASVA